MPKVPAHLPCLPALLFFPTSNTSVCLLLCLCVVYTVVEWYGRRDQIQYFLVHLCCNIRTRRRRERLVIHCHYASAAGEGRHSMEKRAIDPAIGASTVVCAQRTILAPVRVSVPPRRQVGRRQRSARGGESFALFIVGTLLQVSATPSLHRGFDVSTGGRTLQSTLSLRGGARHIFRKVQSASLRTGQWQARG